MNGRDVALAITGVLPGWLSSFALSLVFLSVWMNPNWFGWQGMDRLQTIVFIEVACIYGFLLLLIGREEQFAWLPIIPVAAIIGLYVGSQINPLLGFSLSIHIVARTAGVWSDLQKAVVVLYEVLISLGLMALAWIAVGLLPFPSFAWNEATVPFELWWEVVTWSGSTVLDPSALPAWGFLYFLLMAGADRLRLAARFERRWGTVF